MKTSELTDAALDWAVAKCEKMDPFWLQADEFKPQHEAGELNYSTDWAQSGPIIEREKIGFWFSDEAVSYCGNVLLDPGWYAESLDGYSEVGPTPLVAAMRCYVASKLGDEIDIPEELE